MDITFPAMDCKPALLGMLMVELVMLEGKLPIVRGSTTPIGLLPAMLEGD